MIKKILFSIILFFSFTNVYALSDSEWNSLKQTSSLFRFADEKLTSEWKKQYLSMPDSPQKQALLADQQNWIKNGRDLSAQRYIKQGMSYANAYAKATLDRVEELKQYSKSSLMQNNVERSNDKPHTMVQQKTAPSASQNSTYKQPVIQNNQISPNNQYSSSNRFGPDVCGFQLGMTKDEAIQNALRINFPVSPGPYNSYCHYTDHIIIFFDCDEKTNLVTSFTLSEDLFNAVNTTLPQFANIFSNYWKINFSQVTYYGGFGYQTVLRDKNKDYKIIIGNSFMPKKDGRFTAEIEFSKIQK